MAAKKKTTKKTTKKKNQGYAIIRSVEQGVMSGYVTKIEGRRVELDKARQIFRYDSFFVLPDMAEFGVRNVEACKFSAEMSEKMVMLEACGVIFCTPKGEKSIRGVPAQRHES